MPYEDYQTNDFVTDPFFRRWVLSPDQETQTFWSQWLQQNPTKSAAIQQARTLVLATNISPVDYTEQDYQETWEKINASMTLGETTPVSSQPDSKSQLKSRSWLKIAASVASLALLGAYLVSQYLPSTQKYSTGYGEILKVSLPDGSTATLNANSQLTIASDWENSRKVWLSGEAFFTVTKQPIALHQEENKQGCRKFTVYAGEVAVEVLGTRFNVQKRDERMQVILEEGRVRLKDHLNPDSRISLNEGESITYSASRNSFEREQIDAETRLAWKEGIHKFKATTLSEVATILRDTYGYQVHIYEKELEQRRFSAQVPYGEVELLFALLQESLEIEIIQKRTDISIRKKI